MGEVASSYVSIYPKITDGFAKSLQTQITKSTGSAFGPIDKAADASGKSSGKKFGDSFSSGAKAVLAGGAVVAAVKFIGDSIHSFSEQEDAAAAAGVVFGDSMSAIDAQATGAARSMGIAKTEALNAAITFGTFGKSAGLQGDKLSGFSTQMVQLAADMASFRGTSPEQAIEAIGAALRGEMEPIRQYGVLLDDASLRQQALAMGLIKSTKDGLTPQVKVLAAQAAILKQTSDAQGDYARTADSTANVQKTLRAESANLSAEIGEKLAPAMVAAQKAGISMIQWATDNQAALVPLIATLGTVALAVGGVVAVTKGIEALKAARLTLIGLGDAFQAMGTKAKIATASAGAIGIALVAAGAIYGAFAQKAADAQAATEDYTQALEAENGALGTNVRAKVAKRLEDSGALQSAQALGISLNTVTDAVLGQNGAYEALQARLREGTKASDESATAAVTRLEAEKKLSDALGAENTALNSAVDGYKRVAEATGDGTAATKGNTTATTANSAALQTNAEKLAAVYAGRLKLRGDKRALEAAIDGASQALKDNGKTLDINTAKGRANQQALDEIASAGLAVGGNLDRSRAAYIKMATQMGLSKTAAEKLATSLGLIKSKKVTVEANVRKTGITTIGFQRSTGSDRLTVIARRSGGPVVGPGTSTSDSILAALSNGEHVWSAADVRAAGGQDAVTRLRASLHSGSQRSGVVASGLTAESIAAAVAAALDARGVSMLTIANGVTAAQVNARRRAL